MGIPVARASLNLRTEQRMSASGLHRVLTLALRPDALNDVTGRWANDDLSQLGLRKPLAALDFLAWLRHGRFPNIRDEDVVHGGCANDLKQESEPASQ